MNWSIQKTALVLCMASTFCACNSQSPKPAASPTWSIPGDTVSKVGLSIRCIYQDSRNNYWFATDGEGVFLYMGQTILQITDKQGLCSNYVWNVQEGQDGLIWFRTRDGVCRYDGKTFSTIAPDLSASYSSPDYLKDDFLGDYCFYEQSLFKTELPHTSPLKNEYNSRFHYDIYATCKDSKGNVWFGTCTAGVCKFDGKTYTWLDDPALGAPVRSIFEDKNGTIWIGNNGYGLFSYDGNKLRNLTREMNLENPDFIRTFESKPGTLARIWSITDDQQGNLWIGTYDAGVWKYDGKTLSNYTEKDGLGSNIIWTIYKDRSGKLWVGTDGAGVYTFEGGRFERF